MFKHLAASISKINPFIEHPSPPVAESIKQKEVTPTMAAATAPLMVTSAENSVLKALLGILVPIFTEEAPTAEAFVNKELDLVEAEVIKLISAKFGPLAAIATPELNSLKSELEAYIAKEVAAGIAAAKAAS